MENNFDELLKATLEHLPEKKYMYKPEIQETLDDGTQTIKSVTAVPGKNVWLSIAFNIAYANYEKLRPNQKKKCLKPLKFRICF